jgi:hypothetical protein
MFILVLYTPALPLVADLLYIYIYLYSMVLWSLLPPGPQSLRSGGGSWIGRRLSMLRLSPFRPRLFGDGFRSTVTGASGSRAASLRHIFITGGGGGLVGGLLALDRVG